MRAENNHRMHNENHIERLSQENERGKEGEDSLLARASAVAQGVLKEIEALAGTTSCKGVQIARLKEWAHQYDCWSS